VDLRKVVSMMKRVLLAASILVLAGACAPTATPTPTLTSTPSPPLTDTPIWTPTFCPLPTPEPLWVQPVTSPTDQLSQVVTVHVGYGKEVTVTGESGTFTVAGDFDAYTNPALVEISLLPNTEHHLTVSAKVQPPPGSGCTYPAYTLQTTSDRQGAPLVIVQGTIP
jgi:hypothetical protein